LDVLNMLNVKYIFQEDEDGNRVPTVNPDANGPAWFVENLISVPSADAEIKALDSLNTKKSAIFNTTNEALKPSTFMVDSMATVKVVDHRPDYIEYETNNSNPGFVVFSEMHYPNGWVSYIDGERDVPHYKVNYALRGMLVPAGKHTIVFEFSPQVVKTGSTIALASNVLLGLLIFGGMFWLFRKPKKKHKD